MLNPVAAILEQFRHAVIDPGAPTAAEAAGGGVRLLVPAAILGGVVALGYRVFDRAAPRIAEALGADLERNAARRAPFYLPCPCR